MITIGMMRMTRFAAWGVLIVMAGGLAACRAKQPPPAPAPPPPPPPVVQQQQPPPPPPPPAPAPAPPRQPTDEEIFASKTLAQLNEERPLAPVYFAYDMADLSDTARATLARNADYLRRWTSTRVSIEGHADSRGTNEYNLALGERRATAVRDYLISLGIAAARLTIVSKGEEEPVCRVEAESCWSQNRRAQFVFTAK